MKRFKFIPYDKNLVSRARELRKEVTGAEKKFWSVILKDQKLSKFKFTRQKPVGHFIVDFYCAKLKLGIELDGEVHRFQKIRDQERDNFLIQKFGVRVFRYKNRTVLDNPEEILLDLLGKLSP